MDDQIAISRIKQGDLSGLEALVLKYQVRAVYTAYMILFERSLAEDAAQTAFLRVMEKIAQFDEERPFSPWFFRIVVNEALIISRQQKQVTALDDDPDENARSLADWLRSPQLDPEHMAEFSEMRQSVLKAIKSLKPEQRAAIVMRYYLNMSEIDISERLKRPVSTIKWLLYSARERLQTLLKTLHPSKDRE